MLYSELKERENRFIIALKIGFPFLILTLILFYIFMFSIDDLENYILLIILIPIYIYYIFYLIYNGFKSTLIDSTTKTFVRKEIINKIKSLKKNKVESTIILIKVDNIVDINERYGISNSDRLLKIFAEKLDLFFKNYNFKDLPIGRYGGAHFLLIVKAKKKELTHLLTIFSKELKNIGITDIEIKIDFSLIESDYDEDVNTIIRELFSLIDSNKNSGDSIPNIKPNEFEKIVFDAITYNNLIFKYQPSLNYKTNKVEIFEVLTKVYTKNDGMLSRTQIQRIINHMGYETVFDKKNISILLKELENKNLKDVLFNITISPVSLRNNEFIKFIHQLFDKSKLKPENFVLVFSETRAYEEIHRFKEILNQYRKFGFKIGLDNFGGANCSLEYIKNLPIDIVKFDIEYTKNIEKENYKHILKGYITLLKNLNIKVMIKFIDKKELLDSMFEFEPDFIQGFIISKAKNLKQIGEL
jgi:diguanylate cyclase (GGDEF)-like protein